MSKSFAIIKEIKNGQAAVEAIGKEMAIQNNRATRYPLFAIQEDVKVYVNEYDDWEYRERPDMDTVDDSDFSNHLCPSCRKLYEENADLKDDCNNCGGISYWYYNIETRLTVEMCGVFFTAKACQEHIDANRYHYNNPQVYGIGAWRNPEMQAVQQHLIKLSGEKVPSHYE